MPTAPTPPDETPRPEPLVDASDDDLGGVGAEAEAEGDVDGALGGDLPPALEVEGQNGFAALGPPGQMRVNSPTHEASNRDARRREAEEDRELIQRAQQGDKAAFRKLVERHQRRAFAIAMGLVRDENDARELVQDAFLRVYKGLN